MKKLVFIVAMFLVGVQTLSATATAKYFEIKDKNDNLGGLVDNKFIYIYTGENGKDAIEFDSDAKLEVLSTMAQKQLCADERLRKIVETDSEVIYIYLHPNNKIATIVNVQDCK